MKSFLASGSVGVQILVVVLGSASGSSAYSQTLTQSISVPQPEQEKNDVIAQPNGTKPPNVPAPPSGGEDVESASISELLSTLSSEPKISTTNDKTETTNNWIPYGASGGSKLFIDLGSFVRTPARGVQDSRLFAAKVTFKGRLDPSPKLKTTGLKNVLIDYSVDCSSYEYSSGQSFAYYKSGDVLPFYMGNTDYMPPIPETPGYYLIRYACDYNSRADVTSIPTFSVTWDNIRTQASGMNWSIDRLSLVGFHPALFYRDGVTWFWSKKDFSRVKSVKYRKIYLLQGVECNKHTMVTIETITYLPNILVGLSVMVNEEWPIAPDSTEEMIFSKLCATQN